MNIRPQPIKTPAQQFREYVDHGLVLVPIPPDDNGNPLKGPQGESALGWNLFENCIRSASSVKDEMTQGGLAHLYSGTVAFDLDDLTVARAHFAEHGINIDEYLNAKKAVRIESGRENRGKLLFSVPKKQAKRLISMNKQKWGYELRCATRKYDEPVKTVQDVLPPSIHPETKQPYRWQGDWRNPPSLPKKLKRYWLTLVEEERVAPRTGGDLLKGISAEIVKSALAAIDPDCDYSTWIEVGMALHSAGVGDLWIEWSSGGSKFKAGECEKSLRRFEEQRGITIKTLFYHAREAGWVCKEQSPYALNDLGNAQRLALFVGDRFRFIADFGADMVWSKYGWIKDRSNTLHREFKKTIDGMLQEAVHLDSKQSKPLFTHAKNSGNANKIRAACDLARKEEPICTLLDQWDTDGDLITFSDGTVLNIRTMESRPMNQNDLIRRHINAPFDMAAKCPEFEYLIDNLVGGDKAAREWLLQLWSTGLSGNVLLKVILVIWGVSDSGKTTAVEVLKRVLGAYSCSPAPEFIIRSKYPNSDGPNAEIVNLLGKRAMFIAEFPPARLDEPKIKMLTGGDTQSVRRLYSNDLIDVQCRLTMTITCNPKPFFDATDVGMLRRIRSLNARNALNFGKKRKRLNADDWIFQREAAGIAALLVRSLRDFIEADEVLPKSNRIDEDTGALNLANDRVGLFLDRRCIVEADRTCSKPDLYRAYKSFCDEDGHQPFSARRFHEVMRDVHGFTDKKVRGLRCFVGVEEAL